MEKVSVIMVKVLLDSFSSSLKSFIRRFEVEASFDGDDSSSLLNHIAICEKHLARLREVVKDIEVK